MPNFTATTRLDYRDISGLVASCNRADIEEDILNPGFVRRWRNRAPGLSSLPQIRIPSTPVTYPGGRLGDFVQPVQAVQPILATVLGQRKVLFDRSLQTFMQAEIPTSFPAVPAGGTIAFQFEQGADASDNQVIYDDQQFNTKIFRRQTGQWRFAFGASSLTAASDLTNGRWLASSSGTGISSARDRTLDNYSLVGASVFAPVAGTALLGRSTAGDYLDGYLDSFHMWARELSPLEQDFLWSTIDEDDVSFAQYPRVRVTARRWTDITGTPGSNQIDRVRNEIAINQYYKLATVTDNGVTPQRIQIAASEDGLVKPDSALMDGPFSLSWVEVPGVAPSVVQDVGWSSVFDCLINTPGHYTARVFRSGGGAVLLHFDVEVTA